MKLKTLFKNIPNVSIKGSKETYISGICANSKLVSPGNLFIARKGKTYNGHNFIPEALAAGAAALLTNIYNPFIKHTVQIIHPHIEEIESLVANRYFNSPSQELETIAITGTNGKTTCAYLIKHIFDSLNSPCGLISTIEYIIGSQHHQSVRTTPDLITNYKLLRDMLKQGCSCAVMEVSSHALDQNRTQGISYDFAIFTNLTQDHLDYHENMETYCKAKAKLFTSLQESDTQSSPPIAIINADDPWHKLLLKNYRGNTCFFSIENQSDLQAKNISLHAENTEFDIFYKGNKVHFSSPLIGRHNVYNCLASIAPALLKGTTLETLASIVKRFSLIPGRLQAVPNDLGIHIYIDYAHTPNALYNVLESLREFKERKIITVFGCGGNRDRGKRPEMARIAEELSDINIITSDNPRDEDPLEICKAICQGFTSKKPYYIETDRYKAIKKAIELAETKDLILIAGKGHEKQQTFSRKTIPFNDHKIASELCIQKTNKISQSH